ncbi:MAG: 30S ribosomal protein S17 [Sphingomonadales bacterium]|nr:30S ribosomal protein S17 [Sphingomonadales bacterium]MBM3931815.1 30S ribosomal protein S17 [Sphingomonadales bacterium]
MEDNQSAVTPTTISATTAVQRAARKEKIGVVVSNKMNKSITISVEKKVKDSMYHKFMKSSRKFMAHDEQNECNVGDRVRIVETRPLSKNKCWRLVEIIERAK